MESKRSLLGMVALSGFDRPQSLIQLFVGGSELHGAKVGQTDDTDLYGVYIEDPDQALGLRSIMQHSKVSSTKVTSW